MSAKFLLFLHNFQDHEIILEEVTGPSDKRAEAPENG